MRFLSGVRALVVKRSRSLTDAERPGADAEVPGRSVAGLASPDHDGNVLRGKGFGRFVRVAVACGLIAPMLLLGQSAPAESVSISQLKKKVKTLNTEIEEVSQKYRQTKEKIASVQVASKAAKERAATAEDKLDEAQEKLSALASQIYMNGDMAALELVLGDDAQSLMADNGLTLTLADREAQAISSYKSAKTEVVTATADYNKQLKELKELKESQKARITKLNSSVKTVKAQLAALTEAQQASVLSGDGDVDTTVSCSSAGITATTGSAAKAVAYACAQLGDPYLWGGDGPGSFDCSGLTMMAWKAGGVSLPHSANSQSGMGTSISVSNVRAGDLLFYNYSGGAYNHVAMYVGNGYAIHAPQTGDVVRLYKLSARTPLKVVRL